LALNPVSALNGMLRLPGRRHRRVSARAGIAHIEIKAGRRLESERLGPHLQSALQAMKGVQWAEVDAVLGRVVIGFADGDVDVDDLVDIVETVEQAHDVHGERFGFDRADHPADHLVSQRALTALAADAAGIGVSLIGSAVRLSPLPVEVASVVSLIDGAPRLRRMLEDRVGPSVTDVGLAVANAVAQGLGNGAFGLLVDMLHRGTALSEARAEERCWDARSDALRRPGAVHPPVERLARPKPLPRGPIERYADRAAVASVAAAGGTFLATRSPRRSAAMLLAGIAKPARLGREGFAAQLGRTLSMRGVVVLDQRVLRQLDRIDCVVVDNRVLLAGRAEIGQVVPADGADHLAVHRRLGALFDGEHPERVRKRGTWSIGPLAKLDIARSGHVKQLALQLVDAERYGLASGRDLAAVFGVVPQLRPGGRELVDAAKRAGHMVVVAGGDVALVHRIGADLLVGGGPDLAASIRGLQADGCAVALVAGDDNGAHAASDCAIGIEGHGVPWAADLLCSRQLLDAEFIITAAAAAHEVSRQSAALALTGSGVAATLALLSPAGLAGWRANTAVNAASVVALANGTRAGLALARRTEPRPPPPRWHELPVDDVLTRLDSRPEGLTAQAARRRLGPGLRPVSAPVLLGRSILEELANPLTPVLAGGSALSAVVGSTVDAVLVAGVAAAGSLFGGVQRFRAQRAVAALADRQAPTALVRRGGNLVSLDTEILVPGDIVVLQAGDAVPADCRLIAATNLEVDESALTGESMPVAKDARPVFASVLADRTSMLYEGTTVAAGEAVAAVVAVGAATEANAAIWTGSSPSAGGVEARLRELTAMTLPFAALGGAAVIGGGLLRGRPMASTVGPAVSLAVAAIPEGLPVLATAAQLAAARRLSSRDTLVRNPRAVEALGRVNVLCTDKTGTLTEGRIELHTVVAGGSVAPVNLLAASHREVVSAALRASPTATEGRALPHMTDRAIVRGARRLRISDQLGADGWTRAHELPFEPNRGYHATVGVAAGEWVLTVKGAPEALLGRCNWRMDRRRPVRLESTGRRRLVEQMDRVARQGLRVLAVAERRVSVADAPASAALDDDAVTNLAFLGFVALADPVRATAAAAIDGVRAAGVKVVMVTGDHPSTAEGIAAELGILDGGLIMTGGELDRLDDDDLDAVLTDIKVFARVTPFDKVRIVAAYQRAGSVVAMTGDGANDAPAIRLADVGLAIGERCTPAARNAADVVIADDRIETIVDAIVEGRALWAAVRDALAILLGGNIGEVLFTAGVSVATGRSPLNARQLLLVNLLTDIAPALTIAVRPPDNRTAEQLASEGPDLSLSAPLRRAIGLRAVTTAAGATGAWMLASATGGPRRASTTALVALVGTQLGQTLATSHRHPATIAAACGSAAVMVGVIQTPVVSDLFGCTPLDPLAWAMAVGAATTATAVSVLVSLRAR
jgi:cation-transporting ATPase I